MMAHVMTSRVLNPRLYRHYHSLIGKSLIQPFDLEVDELKSLLWTAIEIKELHERKELHVDVLKNKLIFLETTNDCIQGVPLAAACNLLHTNLFKVVKPGWDISESLEGERKFVEESVDLFFCRSSRCFNIVKMAEKSKIPIVNIMSCRYAISSILADMMTLQLHFGKLQGIAMNWFGPPGKYINTYMEIGTRLGMDVRFCCSNEPDKPLSPVVMHEALYDEHRRAKLEEIVDCRRIDKKTHVIVLSLSKDGRFDLKNAIRNTENNWVFIQKPYSVGSVDQILREHCIVSSITNNSKYIFAAIMLRFLTDYEHRTSMPKFE